MTKIRLAYIHEYTDRHGRLRRYVRLPGRKKVALPGAPGTEAFNAAYAAARASEAPHAEIGVARTIAGTVNAAVISYFNSATFQALAFDTRRTRRNILERWRDQNGDKRIALLQRTHIERMVAAKAGTPSAARNFLNTIRALMAHCLTVGLITSDSTEGVKRVSIKTAGYATWSEQHIQMFERAHPVGSRARTAFALMLYSGQRKSDIIRLGWQHVRGNSLHLVQQKTGRELQVPIHPNLAAALGPKPGATNLTFLVTSAGAPFTANGFGNLFRSWCTEAGLPAGLASHGLRKACCRRLAELGCAANIIAAISGHTTLRMVEKYTRAADQAKMATLAIDTLAAGFPASGRT
jgi:integrase